MPWWAVAVVGSTTIPLFVAWRANRGWTIRHALVWGWIAWLSWLGFAWLPCAETAYATVTMTGAAGVAVLGARRPGIMAWNFIVASLLIVLWLGWAEGLLAGSGLKLGSVRLAFVVGLILTTVLNYVPTVVMLSALFVGAACAVNLVSLWRADDHWSTLTIMSLGLGVWVGCFGPTTLRRRKDASSFDQIWFAFRNRYGAIWSERLREQFNNAAKHNGWPVYLKWAGLHTIAKKDQQQTISDTSKECYEALVALMKRFRYEEKLR